MTNAVHEPTALPRQVKRPSIPPPAADPWWARILLPSAADIIFLALFWMFSFGAWAARLLAEADTGWHIRNGEHILDTLSLPHADYFSYTMAGQPWYAWEWLYDVVLGAVHRATGLNGVVVLTAMLIALTFMLLFRCALRTSGNIALAGLLTLLAAASATVHAVARPHIISWLFTLLWFRSLQKLQVGERRQVYWLAPLMLLWANLHGGFLLGLMLLGLSLLANLWTWSTAAGSDIRAESRSRVRHLTIMLGLCGAATLVTPYGLALYRHIFAYLGSHFMMANISEFQSPDFHIQQARYFALLLGCAGVSLALAGRKLRAFDLITVAFAAWAALYAARNIPTSAILLTLVAAPLLANALRELVTRDDLSMALRDRAASLDQLGARLGMTEEKLKLHILPIALVLAAIVVCLHHGQAFGQARLALRFSDQLMPVGATEYLAQHNIHDHVLTSDRWGGYLIYRMYPNVKVFVDDRHDFYGEGFLREYLKVERVQPGWREVLDRYSVRYVVTAPTSPLSSVLTGEPGWQVAYSDPTAVVLQKQP